MRPERMSIFHAALAGVALFAAGLAAQTPSVLPPPLDSGSGQALVQPAPYVLPPPDHWTSAEVPTLDPLLDRPGSPPPGPFFNVDVDALGVHFRNQLQIAVPVSATRTDTVQFYGPTLDNTVAPRFELGYRLADGWGDLFLGYRFLNTQGGSDETSSFGAARATGRLVFNVFDFGYAAHEYALGPDWDMRWRTGVRATIFYYDAQLTPDSPGTAPGSVLNQHEVDYFWGLGPWVAAEVGYKLPIPGLTILGRLEGALQFGHIDQTGAETLAGAAGSAMFLNREGFEVTVLTAVEEMGLSYTPPGWEQCRFLLGYHFETWFQIGRFNFTPSRGQFDAQGIFARAEITF
jgi:hypothetical protein